MKLYFGATAIACVSCRCTNALFMRTAPLQDTSPCEFCTGKTRAGGTVLNCSNIFLCRLQENKSSIEGLTKEEGTLRSKLVIGNCGKDTTVHCRKQQTEGGRQGAMPAGRKFIERGSSGATGCKFADRQT